LGLFDERDYFLGEFAFLVGCACRVLGKRDEAFRWLDRAEAGFRHTVNPEAGLANVAYTKLALRYEMGRYEDVLDLISSLVVSFERLGMGTDVAKCGLLKAMALKQSGLQDEALATLSVVEAMPDVRGNQPLHGRVLVEIGDVYQQRGQVDAAMASFKAALPKVASETPSFGQADLKLCLGSLYSGAGRREEALPYLRSAASDFATIGMETRLAHARLMVADELLALDHPREAEWEILQALPTIEEQKMVPEGFAAVALLRESVKRRKTDPNALRELREHLQKQN
jgi:tetratricopeptide (TPR) repeat protein